MPEEQVSDAVEPTPAPQNEPVPAPTDEKVQTPTPEGETVAKEEDKRIAYEIKDINGNLQKRYLGDILENGDCYISAGKLIFKYAAIQKIAKYEDIVEKRFEMVVTPMASNYQQHGLNLWVGFKGDTDEDNWVRGSGEASALNTGVQIVLPNQPIQFLEATKIDARYKLAMADKRAFCRAVLKFIGMFNAYGDVEAKEFEQAEAKPTQQPAKPPTLVTPVPGAPATEPVAQGAEARYDF